jgi:hypothetical protein
MDGVCHYCAKEEIEYTFLDRWEHEYKLYLKLIKVKIEPDLFKLLK